MRYACFARPGGEIVTPEAFIQRATPEYRAKGIHAYCPSCGEPVHPYGVQSSNPDVPRSFHHPDRQDDADPLDDCPQANRGGRFRGMYADGWDTTRGERLRAQFFERDTLCAAYEFCRQMCHRGGKPIPFPVAKFGEMIRRADQRRIWAYRGIPLWAVPFTLLALVNIEKGEGPRDYPFHFLIQKGGSSPLSQIWEGKRSCRMVKCFSDGGNVVRGSEVPIGEDVYLEASRRFGWVLDKPRLLAALMALRGQ